MRIVRTIAEMQSLRPAGKRVLVPTMGALHEGHATLMRRARDLGDETIVSLFVNPSQFGPNEDLDKYPRTFEADVALCETEFVNILFAPTVNDIYPSGFNSQVQVGNITTVFEGASRPGHLDGVATVVLKLFHIVAPTLAVFGKKDRQQCAVVERMVRDLNLEVALEFAETIRESTGLAMSSRNRYFGPEQMKSASLLYQTLKESANRILHGEPVSTILEESRLVLTGAGFELEYLELVDPSSFRILDRQARNSVLIVAATYHGVRLIDNYDV